MSSYGKLPTDYPVDALSVEAERRGKKLGQPYSYGQLVADTTREEREQIAEDFKRGFRRRRGGGTKSAFLETESEAAAEVCRKKDKLSGDCHASASADPQ